MVSVIVRHAPEASLYFYCFLFMEEQQKTKRFDIIKKEAARALGAFSPLERLIFISLVLLGTVMVFVLVENINDHFMVDVPDQGGTLSEGIIGTPRFVNPLLAVSDADRDITKLVYRGLMKKDATGALVPDIAKSYVVSDDGLTYTFTLGKSVFQDGTPVTADDVFFTIQSAHDPLLKSAERVKWEGVQAKVVDPQTISFTLKDSYAPFLENTILGILPKHIWSKIPYENWSYSDHNTKTAIGNGFYKIATISQNTSGIPDSYTLSLVKPKEGVSPKIDAIKLSFYANENDLVSAYENGDIDTLGGIDPDDAQKLHARGATILSTPLPRVFGLFFNQSQAKIFTDSAVRKAISLAINKDTIVTEVLKQYGTPDDGPVPNNTKESDAANDATPSVSNPKLARAILEKAGWKLGDDGIYTKQTKKDTERLSFEIATNDTPELTKTVNLIKNDLQAVGIEAIPKVYENGSLNQDIIRPRKFQALFFGEVVVNQSNIYAFWHSSQIKYPGLNITGYANSKVDKLLENGLSTLDTDKEQADYAAFSNEINNDIPAVFVYSPAYIYAVRPTDTGITLGAITTPEDRFANITNWYLATDHVWKIFARKNITN